MCDDDGFPLDENELELLAQSDAVYRQCYLIDAARGMVRAGRAFDDFLAYLRNWGHLCDWDENCRDHVELARTTWEQEVEHVLFRPHGSA
jgi:hypothetical protein